jgi:[ribosomal protein S5]-alanine N-acetyltransferase
MNVVEIAATDTHDLRRRVLRDGTLSDAVVFDGDDDPTTFHLGIRDGDRLVATSTWLRRDHPLDPDVSAHQLRGMAIEPDRQGEGIGAHLLAAGIERCVAAGSELVWAHARSTALDFYLRHGFAVSGEEYTEAATGLAHVDVVRPLRST